MAGTPEERKIDQEQKKKHRLDFDSVMEDHINTAAQEIARVVDEQILAEIMKDVTYNTRGIA